MAKRTGNPRGGKRPGAGRPAGVSNAATEERRQETREAIVAYHKGAPVKEGASAEYLIGLELCKVAATSEEDAVRLDALKHLDNRLQGRPREALELSGPGGGPLQQRVFRSRLAGGEAALAPPPAAPPAPASPGAAKDAAKKT